MKFLRDIMARENLSAREVSRRMGRHDAYLSVTLNRGSHPRTDTLASMLDAMGYDLVAVSRDDGHEVMVTPDQQ